MNMYIAGVKRLVLIMEDEFQIGLLDDRIFFLVTTWFTIWISQYGLWKYVLTNYQICIKTIKGLLYDNNFYKCLLFMDLA